MFLLYCSDFFLGRNLGKRLGCRGISLGFRPKKILVLLYRMPGIVAYILGYVEEDSAYGDLARDMSVDAAVKKDWGYLRLRAHLIEMRATHAVLSILAALHSQYKNGVNI